MGRQTKLVFLLFLSIGAYQLAQALSVTSKTLDLVTDDITDNEISDEDIKVENDFRSPKIVELPKIPRNSTTEKSTTPIPKHTTTAASSTTPIPKHTTTAATSTTAAPATITKKHISDEYLHDLIEASHHSKVLADNLRFNKMLPDDYHMEKFNSTNNKSDEVSEEYDYYDDYDYEEEAGSTEATKFLKDVLSNKPEKVKKLEMKPIEGNKPSKIKDDSKKVDNTETNHLNEEIDDEDDYDEDDEDEDIDEDEDDKDMNSTDDLDVVFSQNVPCPRYCSCARNINSYMVATCSRLDPETQKFGADITDIIVTDVGPKYPILLGPDFFLQLGLKHVSSIKIANCTVEYLHPEAFNGLDELYAVNLTNVGLSILNPNTFANNKKLRILTISGNDLSIMSSIQYLLKSNSIEELDLSRNNLMELNPNAFSKLSNIVYINLSNNNLEKIPEHIFDPVETIEELDLSYNQLKSLPQDIFNRTALGILHLKYNDFTDNLSFGNSDLQQLDLSFNSIQHVHHRMFDKMTGLLNLNLKGNGITKIQPDSFLTLKKLRHIDLSVNDLDQISSMAFYKNSELDVIRLNDNPKLSQLPTDGFISYNGYFTVYLLDISNCAIGALGHKTFSTMPHLATLNLAWNNINNLESDTFSSLTKLSDLDLSNNLISRVDELLFMNNNDLAKLNLAGNPIRKLSIRLFLPLNKLKQLDVSDCDLTSLLSDREYGVGREYKFYETLRTFNASNNQIKTISSNDIKYFKNLRTLDIGHNPLKCNEGFQNFIRHVLLKTNIVPKKVPTMAEMKQDATEIENESPALWAKVAHEVCSHHGELNSKKPLEDISKTNDLDERLDLAEKQLKKDSKDLESIVQQNNVNKMHILKDSAKKNLDKSLEKSEEDLNNGGEDKDGDDESEYDEDEDDDDDDDDEYDNADKNKDNDNDNDKKVSDYSKIKDHGVKIEEIELSKETRDKFLRDKLLFKVNEEADSSDDYSEENEIFIDHKLRSSILSEERNLILFAAVFFCFAIIFAVFVKCLFTIMHKRGERYRMALMNAKESIVYQKLTEEIKPPVKEPKQPKVHRYAPINPV